mgnify:CR=1 FL=1
MHAYFYLTLIFSRIVLRNKLFEFLTLFTESIEKIETTVQTRISTLIADLGLTVNSFANAIGVTQSTVQSITSKRQANPGYLVLNKICTTKFRKGDELVNVDANWLLIGIGEMYRAQSSNDSEEFRALIWAKIEELEKKIKKGQ